MTQARNDQWTGRFRRLRDAEAASAGRQNYDGADRAMHLRMAALQRWSREVMLPLVRA